MASFGRLRTRKSSFVDCLSALNPLSCPVSHLRAITKKRGIPIPFLLFFVYDCFELLQSLFWIIILLRCQRNENMSTTGENRRTLGGIVHVLDICALPLIAIPVIRVIEPVVLIKVVSINCDPRGS